MELRGEDDPGRAGRHAWWIAAVAGAVGVALVAGVLLTAWVLRPSPAPARARSKPPASPPAMHSPVGLRATGECDGFLAYRATLVWRPPAPPVDGYRVYRSARPEGPYRLVGAATGLSGTTFLDHGLGSSTDYYYVIRATAGGRVGPPSGVALASTPFVCLS
jgi:hypothetical protein